MKRNGKRKSYTSIARNSIRAISTAAKVARRLYTRTATESSRNSEGPSNAITDQHDSRTLYRRKRAPKYIRRKARRKYKSYLVQALNAAGNQTNLFNNSNSEDATIAGAQDLFCLYSGLLYGNIGEDIGVAGARKEAIGTIYNFFQNVTGDAPDAIRNSSKKLYLTGMTTDYTISNLSVNLAEVDVYEFVFRKTYAMTIEGSGNQPLKNELQTSTDDEKLLPGATTGMVSTNLGWTPFDSESLLKYIVIKSKQRFYMSGGKTISFVRRVNFKKPIRVQGEDFDSYIFESGSAIQPLNWSALRGATRGIIVVYRGVPGVSSAESVQLGWNAQTRYKGKFIEPNVNSNAFGL